MAKTVGTVEKAVAAEEEDVARPKKWLGTRHTQYVLYFLLLVIAYGVRVNLSVAIVAMTTKGTSDNPDVPTYDWKDNSIVLSSFFWGYIITQIPAGQLAGIFGPKWFLVGSSTICALASILVPLAADTMGSKGVMACRMVQGLSQGFIFPSLHTLLSKWVPLPERSRVSTIVYAAGPFGTVVASPITGWVSASWWGWPPIFYIYGAFGIAWAISYAIFGVNSPTEHRSISPEEKFYIQKTTGRDDHDVRIPTPWGKILTSLPFWAVLVAHCGQNWGYWTLQTEIPTYMSDIMNFDIKSNGVLSAAPYFVMWLMGFAFSPIADYMISRGISIAFVRKLMQTLGVAVPAIALIFLSFVGEGQRLLALSLLVVAVGFNSATFSGFNINHIDLTHEHAGTLMGLTNCAANICSLLAPLLVQFIVTEGKSDVGEWRIVFLVAAAVYLSTDLFFCWFGSGSIQDWSSDEESQDSFESTVLPAITLFALSFIGPDLTTLGVALLVISVGLNAGTWSGFAVNHIDLAPNHAGILMGITNCVSNIFSILAPLFVQFIVTDKTDPAEWRVVFFLASAIYIVSDAFYVLFADGRIQSWNNGSEKVKGEDRVCLLLHEEDDANGVHRRVRKGS